jgi:hypothetical protein
VSRLIRPGVVVRGFFSLIVIDVDFGNCVLGRRRIPDNFIAFIRSLFILELYIQS